MRIRSAIYLFAAMLLVACTADDTDDARVLTPEQSLLIGLRVDFSTAFASPFKTRTTYQANGSFNEGDQMRIFRQYADESDATGTVFNEQEEIFRTYYLKMDYASGSSVSLNSDWVPTPEGYGKLMSDTQGQTFPQTSADSLTWENGKTVRFRAWGRSNLSGAIMADSKQEDTKASYYPDYTVSDWVTVSGPTQNIPLTMRHLACRIAVVPKSGNELVDVKMCLDKEDYEKEEDHDAVMVAYNKMCMPAGVDDATFLLTAMTKSAYTATTNFKNIEQLDAENIVKMGSKKANYIAESVQHPAMKGNNGNFYLITIPIDMSSENAGDELSLPACTRFKVKLYTVKDTEDYHTIELGKVLGTTEALKLKAGYSYSFSVGYRYNSLTVTPNDSFAWDDSQETVIGDVTDKTAGALSLDTAWFNAAYREAIALSKTESKTLYPSFKVSTANQLYTLMTLSNGTAHSAEFPIAYPVYHPSVANLGAYIDTVAVEGPLDFNHCVVELGNDIDLEDVVLPGFSRDNNHPFRGRFNGNGYALYGLHLNGDYLFEYVKDGVITNLCIESIHPVCLLNSAEPSGTTGWGCYIAGISMLCPSTANSIATTLTGLSYVAGCIHVGSAGGALVGTANNLNMMGCMQVAEGLTATSGALLGSGKVNLNTFKYNYYDTEKSPSVVAIGGTKDDYKYDDYIRGAKSHVLKAVLDYIIGANVDKTKLSANALSEMYGYAPWKAMNMGVDAYNNTTVGKVYPCTMKYGMESNGFSNRYPTLKK